MPPDHQSKTASNAEAGPSQPPVETDPLLPTDGGNVRRAKKPFYRPRPLWIVPFGIVASITRGMTLAPRVEVFTQLACNALHHPYNHTSGAGTNPELLGWSLPSLVLSSVPASQRHELADLPSLPIHFPEVGKNSTLADDGSPDDGDNDDDTDDPRRLPSPSCLANPAVQAGAARLQTIMTTTMGVLSALTTGWWGHFGERRGRTKVLAAATLGLLLTDLSFILVSTPSSPLSHHGHILILISPVIEGLLGAWSTLQATTSAYLSDCTSDGSRSHIFSRFTGVFYLGFSIGPVLGAYLIRHPAPWFATETVDLTGVTHPRRGVPSVTTVFWAAILFSTLNLLSTFVIPESLDKVRQKAAAKADANGGDQAAPAEAPVHAKKAKGGLVGAVKRAVGPLAIFAPRKRVVGAVNGMGGRKKRDWSLTWLALSLFGYLLSMGLFQIKYLYAEHVYEWGAEQLSYYITFVGGARAVNLLFVMPFLITAFKPTPSSTSSAAVSDAGPTPSALHHSITFDLALARTSLLLDITSHSLVTILGARSSSITFSGLTMLSSFASGVHPAAQSLAICIMQRNGLSGAGLGPLFGALSVLQAVGQMILGPLIFGLVYSSTVAQFPQAIFALAACLAVASLALLMLIRPEHAPAPAASARRWLGASSKSKGKGKAKARPREEEPERGRSRAVKRVGDGHGASGSGSGSTAV
ncbi:hypothetical protein DENSPDRAFT_832491 [Dentipellis sp. KUC8613]|nr:hypothetical protein DENSPDRAFT_832491 [Dentipellis sp. KUC8613]